MTDPNPLVSAVIPTHNRSDLILRSVTSALRQSYTDLEVLVIVDGPDEATSKELEKVNDRRLRVVVLPDNGGGSRARNAGVEAARGTWIAFLDDDDEWLSGKIEAQLSAAQRAPHQEPIVSCRFIARRVGGEFVLPTRVPRAGEPISEYLLVREGLRHTEGWVATPTIFAKRSTLLRVPFRTGIRRHEDWDWMLRVSQEPSVGVVFCPEILAICHMEHEISVSRRGNWKNSMQWIQEVRPLITKRAYASFVTCHVAWQAAALNAWGSFFPLLFDAASKGQLKPGDIVRYLSFWLVPRKLRRRVLTTLA